MQYFCTKCLELHFKLGLQFFTKSKYLIMFSFFSLLLIFFINDRWFWILILLWKSLWALNLYSIYPKKSFHMILLRHILNLIFPYIILKKFLLVIIHFFFLNILFLMINFLNNFDNKIINIIYIILHLIYELRIEQGKIILK